MNFDEYIHLGNHQPISFASAQKSPSYPCPVNTPPTPTQSDFYHCLFVLPFLMQFSCSVYSSFTQGNSVGFTHVAAYINH